jgi:hypothetical protein
VVASRTVECRDAAFIADMAAKGEWDGPDVKGMNVTTFAQTIEAWTADLAGRHCPDWGGTMCTPPPPPPPEEDHCACQRAAGYCCGPCCAAPAGAVRLGLGRNVVLCRRSSTSYQICELIRCLYF